MQKILYSLAYLILLGVPAFMVIYFIKPEINFLSLLFVVFITLIIGGIFDIWAVKQNKRDKFFIWEYNSKSILGFKIYGVPIEDFVFFLILTPLFIISIYEALNKIIIDEKFVNPLFIIFVILLVLSYFIVYKYAIKKKKMF